MNHAFGEDSEYLYLSLISGIVSVGMNPASVVQIPAGQARIDRIFGLISRCRYSIHDLSFVRVSGAVFRVPRFNMPFELGLATAISLRNEASHQIRLLEAVRHRAGHSLSDMAGYDPYIHRGCADGVLEVILDVFANVRDRPLDDLEDLRWVYRRLVRYRREKLSAVHDIFRAHPFGRLVLAAHTLVDVRPAHAS